MAGRGPISRSASTPATWSTDGQLELQSRQFFEKNSVDQMRQIEANLRRDANEKKQELRKLVGNRYRDLIESADSIVDMKRSADGLVTSIARMDQESGKLSRKGPSGTSRTPQASAKDAERASRKLKHALAQDVKFLVDTPERIWGAMEHSHLWKASSLYLHAEFVHKALTKEKASQQLLSSTPLFTRQWATLEHFPVRLKAAAKARLQLSLLRPADYAGCLGALVLLDGMSLAQSFTEFLASRKAAMRATFLKARGANVVFNAETVKERLLTIAHTVAGTVCLIQALYMGANAQLLTLLSGADLHATTKSVLSRLDLTPVSHESVQTAATQLIDTFADYIQKGGLKLLETVKTARELASLRTALQVACTDPIATAGASAAPEGITPTPWNEACLVVLNKEVPLWPLFESVFLQRAKDIARLAFSGLSVKQLLITSLDDLKNRILEDHNIAAYMWREHGQDEKVEQAKLKASGVSPKAADAVAVIDAKLLAALSDLSSLSSKDPSDTQLQSHIQECCYDAMVGVADEVAAMIKDLGTKISLHPGAAAAPQEPDVSFYVDDSLFLGRVCRSIAEQSKQLPKIFPPSIVQVPLPVVASRTAGGAVSSPSLSRLRPQTRSVENVLLKQLQAAYRKLYLMAHALWAVWASKELTGMLRESLTQAEWIDPQRRRLWDEVTTVGEEQVPTAEAKQRVPTQTSGYVTTFLFALAQELNRIGGHTVTKFLLQLLFPSVMQSFTALLTTSKEPITRDSTIQLLFDVIYLCEVLSTAKSAPADATDFENLTAAATSMSALEDKNAFASGKSKQLEEQLTAALTVDLDPIDVAFYEPHLRKNSQRLYLRSAVLLGSIVQLNRLHKDSKSRASINEVHNIMPTSAAVQRFVSLPVSQTSADQKENLQSTGTGPFLADRAEDRSSLSMLTQMRRSLGLK